MWKIFFDELVEKWCVSEYSRSRQEGPFTFFFRCQAEGSCARRNGTAFTNRPFWSEGEGDAYE